MNASYLKTYEEDVLPYCWSFSAFFNELKAEGVDVDFLWAQIYDLVIKTLLSVEKHISGYTKDHFKHLNKCFELFGFDVMIDANLKPWLLEINLNPSLEIWTELEQKFKIKLV